MDEDIASQSNSDIHKYNNDIRENEPALLAEPSGTKLEKTEVSEDDSYGEEFVGFSPPPSPKDTITHQRAMELELELNMLNPHKEKIAEVTVEPSSSQRKEQPLPGELIQSRHELHDSRGSSFEGSSSSLEGSLKQTNPELGRTAQYSYMQPFQNGWKREIILNETANEVIYIHPSGLRLKSIKEVSQNLTSGLTMDNFTFKSETLNAGNEYEIISKPSVAVAKVRKSGRIPVPSSNYKIVMKLEEESRKRAREESSSMTPPSKREKLVIKLSRSGSKKMGTPKKSKKRSSRGKSDLDLSHPHTHPMYPDGPLRVVTPVGGRPGGDSVPGADGKKPPRKHALPPRPKGNLENGKSVRCKEENGWSSKKRLEETRRTCSISCPKAMGLIPSQQCRVCLCLYHPECDDGGLTSASQSHENYVCKSCREKPEIRKPVLTTEATIPNVTPAAPPPPPPSAPLTPTPSVAPQTLVTVYGRKFIAVPNLTTPPAAATTPLSLNLLQPSLPPVVTLPATTIVALKTDSAANKKPKSNDVSRTSSNNLMRNMCLGYTCLFDIFKYLTVQELLRAARVCRLWEAIAKHHSLWRVVRMKNSQVKDWDAFVDAIGERRTAHLDLRKMLLSNESADRRDACLSKISKIKSLRHLEIDRASPNMLRSILESCPRLSSFNVQIQRDSQEDTICLDCVSHEHQLMDLRIRSQGSSPLLLSSLQLTPVSSTLRILSLLSFTRWDHVDISCIQSLTSLTDLELGDCTTLPPSFPNMLKFLVNLERVRLERGDEPCPAVDILYELGDLPRLNCVELVNFDIRTGFDDALANLRFVRTLLLVPNYTSQSGTSISLILRGIYRLRETLKQFLWIFTMEFMKITELYIDQNKEKHREPIVNPIPVLNPVPMPADRSQNSILFEKIERRCNESGHIVVLSMDELEDLLRTALSSTSVHAIKLPQQSASRQTTQDLLA